MSAVPRSEGIWRRATRFLRRENLHRILVVLVLMSLAGAALLAWLEPAAGFADWLWWSIVTLTTVGYGDITPASAAGRLVGIVLMFFGIGVLGMFTATVASFFVERNLLKERGMGSYSFAGHTILCGWSHRTREVLRELRGDPRLGRAPVVLVADLESLPVEDPDLHFVRGAVDDETLRRAGLETAATVVITGDDRLDPDARDARVVLATLTVESINPDVYTIVELVKGENAAHCRRARADEIVVGDELGSRMLASAVVDHGISRVISDVLSAREGSDLRRMPLPAELVGRSFLDVLCEVKRANRAIVVGVQHGDEVITNPEGDRPLASGDHLIVIAPGG